MIGRKLGHFRILSELGAGGMGVVYKAQDEQLSRLVALKLLRPEYTQSEDSRHRFLREARAVAAVEHPYIAAIHAAGEEDDILFIAMEYVGGSTLRSILRRGALPPRDALRYGAEIAEGLAHAHSLGVVHRDLKPENIMIGKEGHAKILDFGLAKLVEERDEEASSLFSARSTKSDDETRQSTRLGTPAYMSPEQVRGTEVDHRSDVFAFGATLYESVTGRQIFKRETQADTLAAILRDDPVPASSLNSAVSVEFQWVLDKALSKDPRDRYQDTRDLVVDLEHLRWRTERPAVPSNPKGELVQAEEAPTVPLAKEATVSDSPAPDASGSRAREGSVSPAQQDSDSRAQDGSASARTPGTAALATPPHSGAPRGRRVGRWIVGTLAVAGIVVLASLLPRPFERLSPSPSRVFYERGLHYLREEGETLRSLDVGIQMFHRSLDADSNSASAWAALGEAYWTRFELTKDEASSGEAEKAVSRALAMAPDLPEVLVAQGRGLLVQRRYAEAQAVLQRAVAEHGNLDIAWSNLGWAYRGQRNYAEGLKAIRRAIQLNPQSFRHHVSLGNFYRAFRELEAAIASYRRALELKPNSVSALNNLGSVLLLNKSYDEAADAFTRSLRIEETANARGNLGTAHFYRQDYVRAEENYRRALELEPNDSVHYQNLIDALVKQGKNDEVRAWSAKAAVLAQRHVDEMPQNAEVRVRLGMFCARAGEVERALEAAARAEALQPGNAEILFRSAVIHCIVERTEEALDRLEKAVQNGLNKVEIENDADLERLRSHPRYRRILDLAS